MLNILTIGILVVIAVVAVVVLVQGLSNANRTFFLIGLFGLNSVGTSIYRFSGGTGDTLEIFFTLACGPILLALILHLMRGVLPWRALVAAFVVEVAAILLLAGVSGVEPMTPAIVFRISFTAFGWYLFFSSRSQAQTDRRTREAHAKQLALALLLAVSAVHVAHILRIVAPNTEMTASAVPLVITAALVAFLVAGLVKIATSRELAGLMPDRRADDDSAELLRSLRQSLSSDDIIGDSAIRIDAASAIAGIAPSELTRVVHDAGYSSFRAFLNSLRLERAKQQLRDPAEIRTSVEAIGLGCGFRSRSAFYEAFRRDTGVSPGAYRDTHLGKSVS